MSRYDFWRPLWVALFVLVASVSGARAENPDGPVGAVMLEPSVVLSGTTFHDGIRTFKPEFAEDDYWSVRSDHAEQTAFDASSRRFGLNVLVPVKQQLTLGAQFAYTRGEWTTKSGLGSTENDVGSWEFGFRARYWWNLPY